jgi:hypothetical protein
MFISGELEEILSKVRKLMRNKMGGFEGKLLDEWEVIGMHWCAGWCMKGSLPS